MRKLLAGLGLLGLMLGLSSLAHAGVPLGFGSAPDSYHTSIVGTTATIVNNNITATVSVSSSAGTACMNCFTRIMVEESSTTILNILDGGTTVQVIDGLSIPAGTVAGSGNYTLTEDPLHGPLCLTAGNPTVFNAVVTGGIPSTVHTVVNWEGYTFCGVSRN